ncbi:beta-propeller domain-containing protein [Patescibacteria group bacterium]
MPKKTTLKKTDSKFKTVVAIIFLLIILDAALIYMYYQYRTLPRPDFPTPFDIPSIIKGGETGIAKFTSENDFKDYLSKASESFMGYYGGIGMGIGVAEVFEEAVPTMGRDFALDVGLEATKAVGLGGGGDAPSRVSETTVQVTGIDEPDIVKTDGQEIYYSSRDFYFEPRFIEEISIDPMSEPSAPSRVAPQRRYGATMAINAFPPADLELEAEIEEIGELLLTKDILVVFTNEKDKIIGYDVSDPQKPVEKWQVNLTDRNYLEAARLYQDNIYFITRTSINSVSPCPLKPLTYNDQELTVACTDIYHPTNAIPVDTTYTVLKLDPQTGDIEDQTSFIGSLGQSIIYMSYNSIFVTYTYPGDFIAYLYNFFKLNDDIIPSWVIEKMEKLQTYDLSDQAKMTEFSSIMEKFITSLSEDESLKIENEMTNRMADYAKEHMRELEQTGIVKINISDLSVASSGNVPGKPLNQFSLDEYNNNLRIATTIGGRGSFIPQFGRVNQSVSDVYVLDKNLKISGAVTGLGETERIYSVRFIQDKGYVVTFRETDPFYVLDLSNPKNPQLKGELKIPGYSSYLHPINENLILGIGKEGSNVKLSFFDVSDPTNPTEKDKYILEEYWSDILNTHHAFLLDDKFEVFFLPGSRGGYIFNYENEKLNLQTAVSDVRAKRAIFIDDYLYIIGEDKIVVLDEKNWQRINELELQ